MTPKPTATEVLHEDMPPEEREEFLKAVQQALDEKGPGIPFEKVKRWLLSWGTANELPPPE